MIVVRTFHSLRHTNQIRLSILIHGSKGWLSLNITNIIRVTAIRYMLSEHRELDMMKEKATLTTLPLLHVSAHTFASSTFEQHLI